ncbi:nucleoside-diphosphate-sugar epimerase [Sphingomonas jejuensis]|uniref:Nucleoside-diphosphate-sugar epimerase n=1 Tax=Sphingomonas jejuensis TaxID=904715 RepID=A0ABX0XN16_9SPHN|nr:nucleoside-diphosphate-sugar epimerase [Sphingomonas jejuensis]
MTERWLITGAAGFIGQRLVATLAASGLSVVGWRRSDADLTDPCAVRRALEPLSPTHIVHLAAGPSAPETADWRYVADAVGMVTNLAASMPDHCRLLHTGSMAEFGYAGRFNERVVCRPNSAYGVAKAAATDRAMTLRQITDRKIGVARLFGVYGAGEAPRRLIPHVVKELTAGQRVPLSAGTQVRDFVHVDDVCTTLIALARHAEMPALVNVGTGMGVSVRQVCETIADALGVSRALLGFGELPYRAVDEDHLVAETGLLARYAPIPPQRWLDPAMFARDIQSALAAQ